MKKSSNIIGALGVVFHKANPYRENNQRVEGLIWAHGYNEPKFKNPYFTESNRDIFWTGARYRKLEGKGMLAELFDDEDNV